MASIKNKLQSAIRSGKINIFLLFLAVSFVILLLSKLSKDYSKIVSFDIVTENLPEEQVIIKDSTHTIDILLKTYGFKLLRYYVSNPRLAIDLDKTENVGNRYIWTAASSLSDIKAQFSDNVIVEQILSDTIVFDYDVNFVKKVPIVLLNKVNFAPGYNLTENYILDPDTVRLIGPRVIVDEINMIQTDTMFLDNVKTTIEETLDLTFPEQIETIAMSSKQVKVLGHVDKFTEGTVQIPITITNLPRNIDVNYFPKKVTVIYNTALKNFNSIVASDFRVECDFNELTENASFLSPKLTLKPETVRTAKINQTKIEFIISQ